jgi:hypothetical protein
MIKIRTPLAPAVPAARGHAVRPRVLSQRRRVSCEMGEIMASKNSNRLEELQILAICKAPDPAAYFDYIVEYALRALSSHEPVAFKIANRNRADDRTKRTITSTCTVHVRLFEGGPKAIEETVIALSATKKEFGDDDGWTIGVNDQKIALSPTAIKESLPDAFYSALKKTIEGLA